GYLASNFLIVLVSAGATITSPASRRVRRLGLCSNRCLRFARRGITFPVPVSRERLFAPLCVFLFCMLGVVFLFCAPCRAALSCVPPGFAMRHVHLSTSPRTNRPAVPPGRGDRHGRSPLRRPAWRPPSWPALALATGRPHQQPASGHPLAAHRLPVRPTAAALAAAPKRATASPLPPTHPASARPPPH